MADLIGCQQRTLTRNKYLKKKGITIQKNVMNYLLSSLFCKHIQG